MKLWGAIGMEDKLLSVCDNASFTLALHTVGINIKFPYRNRNTIGLRCYARPYTIELRWYVRTVGAEHEMQKRMQ